MNGTFLKPAGGDVRERRTAATVHKFDEALVAKINVALQANPTWAFWVAHLAHDSSLRLVQRRESDDMSAELPVEYRAGAAMPVAVTLAFTLRMEADDNEGAFGLMSLSSNLLRFLGRSVQELEVFTFGKIDGATIGRSDDDRFNLVWAHTGQARSECVEGTWKFCSS